MSIRDESRINPTQLGLWEASQPGGVTEDLAAVYEEVSIVDAKEAGRVQAGILAYRRHSYFVERWKETSRRFEDLLSCFHFPRY